MKFSLLDEVNLSATPPLATDERISRYVWLVVICLAIPVVVALLA